MEESLLLGRYQLVRNLGSGGFGQTFLARDIHLPGKPLCVVKQLKTEISASNLETAKRLFDREAEMLYKLGSHDRIPRLLAHFQQDQKFLLVQELIEGHTIDKELIAGKPWSEEAVKIFLEDTLQVLAFVHQQNVIHRDIKPANLIRRNKDSKIVLIDFGAVKEVSVQNTSLTVAIGSPGYMAPEQQAFKPKYCSDIYALGMICLQALTGLAVYDFLPNVHSGEYTYAELEADNRSLSKILQKRTTISSDLEKFINTMVRRDYRQRYQTASEALQALEQLKAKNHFPEPTQAIDFSRAYEQLPSFNQPITSHLPKDNFTGSSTSQASALNKLDPSFVKRCRQELALSIGPFANFIIEDVLAENPNLTPQQLVELLASEIPNPRKAQQFKDKLYDLF
jgi:serine/threonine-protein kinase